MLTQKLNNQRTFTALLAHVGRGLCPLSSPHQHLGSYEEEAARGMHTQVTARPTLPHPYTAPMAVPHMGPGTKKGVSRSFRAKHILSTIPSKRDRNTEQGSGPISVSDTNCAPTLTDPVDVLCYLFRIQRIGGTRLDRWHPLNLYQPDPGSTITFFKGFWSQ